MWEKYLTRRDDDEHDAELESGPVGRVAEIDMRYTRITGKLLSRVKARSSASAAPV